MNEEVEEMIKEAEIEELENKFFLEDMDKGIFDDKLIFGLPKMTFPEKEKYVPFTQANYDIVDGKIPIEKINTMLPEDYTLIADKYGDNTYLAYSKKNNELILSYKGSVSINDWREDFETLGTNLLGARVSQGEVMLDVAERYNDIQDKNKKKKFTENLKSFKKNVVAGYDKLANFIKNNALEDLPEQDRPKIKILGHSLGSARAIGTLEMIEHTNFKDNKPLYDYFDIESNVYNSAPYPANDEGDFYFLNDKMRLNTYALGHTRKERYGADLTRMPDNVINTVLFPLTRPAEILARPYLMAYDAIFGEQQLDSGDFYQITDAVAGIPDITRTAQSTYRSGQNFNFGIIEKKTRGLGDTMNIAKNALRSHTTEGLYNINQLNKRWFILQDQSDEIPLKPIITQDAFKNIFNKRQMKKHKKIKKRKKQNPVPFMLQEKEVKVLAEADELRVLEPIQERKNAYCKNNKSDIKCSTYCANNPDIEICKFTDF